MESHTQPVAPGAVHPKIAAVGRGAPLSSVIPKGPWSSTVDTPPDSAAMARASEKRLAGQLHSIEYSEAIAYSASIGEHWADDMAGCKLCWRGNIPFPACVLFSPHAADDEAKSRCALMWCCLLPVPGTCVCSAERGDGGSWVLRDRSGKLCECVLVDKERRAVQCYTSCCKEVPSEQSCCLFTPFCA